LTRNLQLVELLSDISNEHGRTPAEVAVAWTFHHPAVTAAIVGARRASQVEGIVGAGTFRLDNDALRKIDQFLEQNPVPEGEE
jgi:aryl-alcohol dehydrogenase-like predicted oxidoreductase